MSPAMKATRDTVLLLALVGLILFAAVAGIDWLMFAIVGAFFAGGLGAFWWSSYRLAKTREQ